MSLQSFMVYHKAARGKRHEPIGITVWVWVKKKTMTAWFVICVNAEVDYKKW